VCTPAAPVEPWSSTSPSAGTTFPTMADVVRCSPRAPIRPLMIKVGGSRRRTVPQAYSYSSRVFQSLAGEFPVIACVHPVPRGRRSRPWNERQRLLAPEHHARAILKPLRLRTRATSCGPRAARGARLLPLRSASRADGSMIYWGALHASSRPRWVPPTSRPARF